MANLNSPRDGSRIPAILVKDTVSNLATPASGILAGSTEAQAVAIVDGSGAQITSFGGGTQYTDGGTAAAHPIGTGIIYNNGGTYTFVSAANPLPVSATFSPSGTQNVNLTQVGSTSFALGQQLAAASLPVVLTAAQITTLTPPTSVTVTQGTGSNLHAVVDSGTITTVSTVTSLTQFNGNAISTNTGAVGAGVIRTVPANDLGKIIKTSSGSVSSSGNNTLIAAGTNKLKIFAFSLSTSSTSATTCIFQSGASGTELWRVVLQAPTSVTTGANLAVALPSYLFATASATLLNLNLSGANTIHWSASYIDEA